MTARSITRSRLRRVKCARGGRPAGQYFASITNTSEIVFDDGPRSGSENADRYGCGPWLGPREIA